MIWSAADLRALEGIRVGHSEVVYAFVSLEGEPSALDEALLDDEERRRSRRFVRLRDRRRFVRAHAGLRLFLARCLGVDPATVRYETGVHGKPRLLPGLPPLEFNLSHSEELGLLAVARDRSVGVDVEHMRDVPDALSIADTHFSAAERRHFDRCRRPSSKRRSFLLDAQGSSDQGGWRRAGARPRQLRRRRRARIDVGAEAMGRPTGRAEWSLRDLPSPPGYAAAGAVAAHQCPRAVAGAVHRGSGRATLYKKLVSLDSRSTN